MEADFSGYATRTDIVCADGVTIKAGAFKHQDGKRVPLVWQHQHNEPANVLGHGILENRADGVYVYGFFNNGASAAEAKELLAHGDVEALSIFAGNLTMRAKNVVHGAIKEVSLVLSGANPGAFIDRINILHDDSGDMDEAIIYSGLTLEHADGEGAPVADENEKTIQDVLDTMNDEQLSVLHALVGEALEASDDQDDSDDSDDSNEVKQDDLGSTDETITHQEGSDDMTRNVFEQNPDNGSESGKTLSHSDMLTIFNEAQKMGSLKEAVLAHAGTYGINDIDKLFPDPKAASNVPEWIKRPTEWVAGVINGAKKSPFSRIKSLSADITHEEARAKGYITGNLKKEQFFGIASRVTTPTTVYKKQKLDRDDIIDITSFDVVAWIKAEMRVMLEEEIARAILIGDGRDVADEDKIKDPPGVSDGAGIRSILNDDPFYAHQITLAPNVTGEAITEEVLRSRKHYKGSGNPVFYTSEDTLTDLILLKDRQGRRLYPTEAELASALRVSRIVPVPVFENVPTLIGIITNIGDYTVGADAGGQITMFDDFDIDYNQYKYLIETRISGALTHHKTAVVIRRGAGTAVTPTAPTQNGNNITIPTVPGVVYTVDGEVVTGTIAITEDVVVEADADTGYYFPANTTREWIFAHTP